MQNHAIMILCLFLISMLKTDDIHPPNTGISVHFSCSLS